MICEKCGRVIEDMCINMFDREGADHWHYFPLEECETNAVFVDVDTAWTGYELSEEEQLETIKCPLCGQFPFADNEVQVHEIVRIVMFRKADARGLE